MTHGEYEVIGRRSYRGHEPGSVFEALIPAGPEARAIARGDIRLIRRVKPRLQPGSYRLPSGWTETPSTHQHTEAPQGASLVPRGG